MAARSLNTLRVAAQRPCSISRYQVRCLSVTPPVRDDQRGARPPGEDTAQSSSRTRPTLQSLANHPSVSAALAASKERARVLRARLDSSLSDASQKWNAYSGYTAVEHLKAQIVQLEASLQEARATLDLAKQSYVKSVAERSSSQKEINDLLSRKSVWTDADLHRYTELLRQEHHLFGAEQRGESHLEQATADVQSAFDQLMRTVLLRYHEEQIWSDRVRGLSTWGSLLVAGLNAALFLLAILLVEPYKRKKLAQTFEKRLLQGEEQSRELITSTIAEFEDKLEQFASLRAGVEPEATMQSQSLSFADEVQVPAKDAQCADETAPLSPTFAPVSETRSRTYRTAEENIVYASTVGVVVGALLSTLLSLCWN